MENGYIPIDGSKIYYEKSGVGEAIIFLHADTLDSRQWDNQFAYFSKKFTAVRYDIRGFGKSEIPASSPYSFSEDLLKLMDALFIKKAHLVGLSLGAAIAIDFALTHQDRVLSLVLADAGISGDGFHQEFIERIRTIEHLAKIGDMRGAKTLWSALSLFDTSRNNSVVWKRVSEMVADSSGYRWYGANQPADIVPPAAGRLSNIKTPALVLVGEHDGDDFQRKSAMLHEKISGSRWAMIPNAGHLSNMDNPEAFNAVVAGGGIF